jgi:hypothetical protein
MTTKKATAKKNVKVVRARPKHKHLFCYMGGEAKCICGKYLQPDGRITNTATGKVKKKKKK